MTDLQERNTLFERGTALGLNWITGETADGTPTIYFPLRDPLLMRASLYPFAHNWMLSYTTPVAGSALIKVDKLNREVDVVLRAVSVAIQQVIELIVESEPASALGLIGFLGAFGIATDDEKALTAATAGRARAKVLLGN